MLAEQLRREPARPAAEIDDCTRLVEPGVGDELGGGSVLVEALPVLRPPNAVVDPAGLLRSQYADNGGHPGMMTR